MTEPTQYLVGGLTVGGIYRLIGVAYTAVYNVTRITNFAQGDFAMIDVLTAIAVHQARAA